MARSRKSSVLVYVAAPFWASRAQHDWISVYAANSEDIVPLVLVPLARESHSVVEAIFSECRESVMASGRLDHRITISHYSMSVLVYFYFSRRKCFPLELLKFVSKDVCRKPLLVGTLARRSSAWSGAAWSAFSATSCITSMSQVFPLRSLKAWPPSRSGRQRPLKIARTLLCAFRSSVRASDSAM